jgi:hypothetical protein
MPWETPPQIFDWPVNRQTRSALFDANFAGCGSRSWLIGSLSSIFEAVAKQSAGIHISGKPVNEMAALGDALGAGIDVHGASQVLAASVPM